MESVKKIIAEVAREVFEQSSKEFDNKLAKQTKSFNEQMKQLSRQIGGIGNSNGRNAEEFFFRSLEKTMTIENLSFDSITVNMNRYKKDTNLKGQYDIVLNNCDTTLVVEVKYKLTPDYVDQFYHRSLPKFKQLFPEFAEHKLYGGVASFSDFDNARHLAAKYGLFVLGQAGQSLKVLNKDASQL